MKIDEEKDEIIFSSGTRAYAHWGLIGLGEPSEDGEWSPSEGADGGLFPDQKEGEAFEVFPEFNQEDAIELANHMIDLWKRFKVHLHIIVLPKPRAYKAYGFF